MFLASSFGRAIGVSRIAHLPRSPRRRRNARNPTSPMVPAPMGACRSQDPPAFPRESFRWMSRSRASPTTASNSPSVRATQRAPSSRYPAACAWQVSKQNPSRGSLSSSFKSCAKCSQSPPSCVRRARVLEQQIQARRRLGDEQSNALRQDSDSGRRARSHVVTGVRGHGHAPEHRRAPHIVGYRRSRLRQQCSVRGREVDEVARVHDQRRDAVFGEQCAEGFDLFLGVGAPSPSARVADEDLRALTPDLPRMPRGPEKTPADRNVETKSHCAVPLSAIDQRESIWSWMMGPVSAYVSRRPTPGQFCSTHSTISSGCGL